METSGLSLIVDGFGVKLLGSNLLSTLLHANQNIIQHQWNGLVDYIMDLVWIGLINKYMSPCLFKDMWKDTCINISTKCLKPESTTKTGRTNL